MSIDRRFRGLFAVVGILALAGCGDAEEADVDSTPVAAGAGSSEVAAAPEVPADAPATIAELFPEGEGRQIVLANCASCHAVACAAIGRRPTNRWEDLKLAHAEHVPSLSEEEREAAFTYLAANFSDQQPEPYVPAEFLERGCTPF